MKTSDIRMPVLMVMSFILVYCSGCSFVSSKQVEADSDEPGLRYFLPAPILIIEELPDSRWTARLDVAVDSSREYTLQPYVIFGANNTDIAFNGDGTLKSFKLNQNTTTVSEALVTALKDIEIKRFEIEKALLDDQLKALAEGAQAATDTNAMDNNTSDIRRAFVYRINGDNLVQDDSITALVISPKPPPKPAGQGNSAGRSGAASMAAKVHNGILKITFTNRNVSEADIKLVGFLKGNELVDVQGVKIQDKSTFIVPTANVQAAGATKVAFPGLKTAEIETN